MRFLMNKILVAVSLFISFSATAQPHLHFADSVRALAQIPELAYAVVQPTGVAESGIMGRHAVHLPDTATRQDRFHLGSNTKAMTAFIIAKYVERGLLQWNTPFFAVFPEWKKKTNQTYWNITLSQLLSHRAGIQPFTGFDDPEIPPFAGTNAQKRKAFGKFVLGLSPALPDSLHAYVYSNADYTLATLMLERRTGRTWEQLVEQIFNKDLHLQVQLGWPENQRHADTWGHLTDTNKLIPVSSAEGMHLDYTEPAGDINMTLGNYTRFIRLFLEGWSGRNNYLRASTYRYLLQGVDEYAMGWFNLRENDIDWSTHFGTVGTYFAVTHIDRTHNIAFIVLVNAFNQDTQMGVRSLLRKLKADYQQALQSGK